MGKLKAVSVTCVCGVCMQEQTDRCHVSILGLPPALAACKLCASDSLQLGAADTDRSSNKPCVRSATILRPVEPPGAPASIWRPACATFTSLQWTHVDNALLCVA